MTVESLSQQPAAETEQNLRRAAHAGLVGGVTLEAIGMTPDVAESDTDAAYEAQLGESYAAFKDTVPARELGRGGNAVAYLVEKDGKQYAKRMLYDTDAEYRARDVRDKMRTTKLGRGIPHLEQLVAASPDTGETYAEVMTGKEVSHLQPEDIQQITGKQIDTLLTTYSQAHAAGIMVDPKPSNFFYDKDQGFGIIDYLENTRGESFAQMATELPSVIANFGVYGAGTPRTVEAYAERKALAEASEPLLRELQRAYADHFSGAELQALQDNAANMIDVQRAFIANCNDPEWVTKQVREVQESERRLAAAQQSAGGGMAGWGAA